MFQQSDTPPDGLLALVFIVAPTLTYGTKKLLVHSNGHNPCKWRWFADVGSQTLVFRLNKAIRVSLCVMKSVYLHI